jgi:hypothetical protein
MTDEDRKPPVVLSRDELYSQIWTTPMIQLAAQYGITGTGLAKICARLNVPCPPRGYWAKKAVGKPVVQYRLPEPEADTPLQVTITPAPPPAPPSKAQTELQQQIESARAGHSGLTVSARLARPHPIIAGWLAEHDRKKQEALRERDPTTRRMMQPEAFTEMNRRAHRFLDALFKAIEPLGFTVKTEPYQRVYFEFANERVDYQLREKQKQVRRPLTDNEKRWSYAADRGWIQELQPTGVLIFTIKTWLADGMRREWKDEADKPLEDHLPEIIAILSLAGPFLVKQRQERAEAERRRWEEENRRYRERQLREQDEKRWQRFLELAHQCDLAASARRLLAELGARPQSDDIKIGGHPPAEWLAWANDWLERFDPLMQKPQELYKQLADI